MAWYKFVKTLRQQQRAPHLHSCHMTCGKPHPLPVTHSESCTLICVCVCPVLHPRIPTLHSEKPLLSRAFPLREEFQLKSTSHTPSYPLNEAILQFSDHPKFWIPSPQDTSPCLEVQFQENHIITTVEIRGICTDRSNCLT